jgi:hypothetical protein
MRARIRRDALGEHVNCRVLSPSRNRRRTEKEPRRCVEEEPWRRAVEEKEVDRRVAGVPWRTEPAAWGRAALQQASRAMSPSTGGMLGEDRQESGKQRRGVGYSDGGHREAGR